MTKNEDKTIPDSIYILGAGFTKAAIPAAPLNKDLLNSSSYENRILEKYKKIYKTDDIEILLTRLDLELNDNNEKKKDRYIINESIASYFRKFRFSSNPPSWVKTFALDVLKPNDSIITLNYDCFLEGALDNYKVWNPNKGYARVENPLLDNRVLQNTKKILIYKIHGSENFVESSVLGKNQNQTTIGFEVNSSIYPKSGVNTHFGGGIPNPRQYIIAPSFVKIPHVQIVDMMLEILDIVEKVKNLIIIGCGMRPEDNFLWLLLVRFLNKCLECRKQLIIVDPLSENICKRISDYWVGDIKKFADVVPISCGIENGIDTLKSTLTPPQN